MCVCIYIYVCVCVYIYMYVCVCVDEWSELSNDGCHSESVVRPLMTAQTSVWRTKVTTDGSVKGGHRSRRRLTNHQLHSRL